MPHRLHLMTAPIAAYQTAMDGRALQAILSQATHEAAMQGVLMGRGIDPGTSRMIIDTWRAQGLLVAPSVYAPAHVAEAVATGSAAQIAQQVFRTQPSLLGYAAAIPGYEQSMAQAQMAQVVSPLQKQAPVQAISPLQKSAPMQAVSPFISASPWQSGPQDWRM